MILPSFVFMGFPPVTDLPSPAAASTATNPFIIPFIHDAIVFIVMPPFKNVKGQGFFFLLYYKMEKNDFSRHLIEKN